MPTVLSHPAVPLALSLGLGANMISRRLLLAGVIVSAIPDLDVLGFKYGVAYASQFGHRGFTHSLMFALLIALLGTALFRQLRSTPGRTFGFLFVSIASHGILDTLTNGGLGVELFWPFSDARFFAAFRPIDVSPIGLTHLISGRGLTVIGSELLWVWLPVMTAAFIAVVLRRIVTQVMQSTRTE